MEGTHRCTLGAHAQHAHLLEDHTRSIHQSTATHPKHFHNIQQQNNNHTQTYCELFYQTIHKHCQSRYPAQTITVALDMRKAFDTINIHTLIRKLLQTKIPVQSYVYRKLHQGTQSLHKLYKSHILTTSIQNCRPTRWHLFINTI